MSMNIASKIIRSNNLKHNNPNRQTVRNTVFDISTGNHISQ